MMLGLGVSSGVLLGVAMAGCAATAPELRVAVDRTTCEAEAVFLTRNTAVFAAPAAGAAMVRELSKDNVRIYRCAGSGAYLGIEFPAPGEPTDCRSRRGKENACPTGWVRTPLSVNIAG